MLHWLFPFFLPVSKKCCSQKKAFVKERGKMITIFVARRLQIRVRPVSTVSKLKERLDFIVSLVHILMFYTLLLASVTWYEKYMSWILQLTTWLLSYNCYFYIALLCVNNIKNTFLTLNKESIKRTLSHLFTFIYIMNVSLTYYFVFVIYPKLNESDAHRLLVIYMYPGLSVLINIIIDFSYTKSLHFQGLGSSVIIVSLYMTIIGALRYIFTGLMLTETELGTAAWFDPIYLRGKFQVFITVMSINYLGLKFILHTIVVCKSYKQKLRAQILTSEIHH